ncbi:6650_t:CDS:2 [Funneliformis geosporum]|uniref:13037_t:CDS:1 n=1 Tax=Funneliformis geosporum TaxID=1117311 RepID=A0A9W4SQF8_9GLOM|nr:6650_t:CDS:2 [Funneliformis geosporum]CAI2177132.1 13037_t:CDS:2 [Funneliformis geosporum]
MHKKVIERNQKEKEEVEFLKENGLTDKEIKQRVNSEIYKKQHEKIIEVASF